MGQVGRMRNKRMAWVPTLFALLLVFAGVPGPTLAEIDPLESEYERRAPIRIQTDADFTEENGVVGGSGTEEDPYRISGWHIIPTRGLDTGIAIGAGVEHSYFLIDGNFIQLDVNATRGITIGTNFPGVVSNNTISASGVLTLGVFVAPGVNKRQDPVHPLRIESNLLMGSLGQWQYGIAMHGTAATIHHNQIKEHDFAIRIGASPPIGPQVVRVHQNDFIDSDWGVASFLFNLGTANTAVIDARDNYWGDPNGPTTTICFSATGCETALFGERGAQAPPYVLSTPYATEPFFPDG